jgi:hypothetical protein
MELSGKKRFTLVLALSMLVLAASASAQLLDPVFQMLSDLRLIENYAQFPYVIDMIIFLILFIGLARFILAERIGSVAATGLGLMLSIGLTFFEYSRDFSIGKNLGPVAMLIAALLVGMFLFMIILRAGGQTKVAALAAYAVTFALMVSAYPPLVDYLRTTTLGGALFAIMTLLWLIAVVYVIVAFTRQWGGEADQAQWPGRFADWLRGRQPRPPAQQPPAGPGGGAPPGQGGGGGGQPQGPVDQHLDGIETEINQLHNDVNALNGIITAVQANQPPAVMQQANAHATAQGNIIEQEITNISGHLVNLAGQAHGQQLTNLQWQRFTSLVNRLTAEVARFDATVDLGIQRQVL